MEVVVTNGVLESGDRWGTCGPLVAVLYVCTSVLFMAAPCCLWSPLSIAACPTINGKRVSCLCLYAPLSPTAMGLAAVGRHYLSDRKKGEDTARGRAQGDGLGSERRTKHRHTLLAPTACKMRHRSCAVARHLGSE